MGKSRAEYMRDYRQKKREERLKSGILEPKKIARNSTQRSRDFRARAANSFLSQKSTVDQTTALPNLVVSHATLGLPFPPTPSTSTTTAFNIGSAEINLLPEVVEQKRVVREDVEQIKRAGMNLAVKYKQTKDCLESKDCGNVHNPVNNERLTDATSTVDGNKRTITSDQDNNSSLCARGEEISTSTECHVQNKNPNTYKYCIVPVCTNTTVQTPDKHFFSVPKNYAVRQKWCKAMNRDERTYQELSGKSSLYCCEDHFDLEHDLENDVKYKLVGGILKLKKDVIPHKFSYQYMINKNVAKGSLPDISKQLKKKVLLRDLGVFVNQKSVLKEPLIVQCKDTNECIPAATNKTTNLQKGLLNKQVMLNDSYIRRAKIIPSVNRSRDLATETESADISPNIQREEVPSKMLYFYIPVVTTSQNVSNTLQFNDKQRRKQLLNIRNDYDEAKDPLHKNVEESVAEIDQEPSNKNFKELSGEVVEMKEEIDDEIVEDIGNENTVKFADTFVKEEDEMSVGNVEEFDDGNVDEYADDMVDVKDEIGIDIVDEFGNGNIEQFDNVIGEVHKDMSNKISDVITEEFNQTIVEPDFIDCSLPSQCRACLKDDGTLIHIDDDVRTAVSTMTGLHMSSDDGLPQLLCSGCVSLIESFMAFKYKMLENHRILLGLRNMKDIKMEVNSGDDDGSCPLGLDPETTEDSIQDFINMENIEGTAPSTHVFQSMMEINTDDSQEEVKRKRQINDSSDDKNVEEERNRKNREKCKRYREKKIMNAVAAAPISGLSNPDEKKREEVRKQKNREKTKRCREKKKHEVAAPLISGSSDSDEQKREEERKQKNREKTKRCREKKKNEVAAVSISGPFDSDEKETRAHLTVVAYDV